jgi:glycosyltransferase involved in cell wall biosynthesis
MSTIPPISIIIPTLNEEKYLPALLDSLKYIQSPIDIIVVDGSSVDRTVHIVEEYKKHFRDTSSLRLLSATKRNIGYQRNLGAAAARHDVFVFCDADMLAPHHEVFSTYISNFVHNNYVVACPTLVPIEPGIRIALAHTVLVGAQRILASVGRPFFGGAGLTTTREVFERIGGFDASIHLGEDVDYSMRASKHGLFHHSSVRWSVSARRFIKYGYWWALKQTPEFIWLLVTHKFKNDHKIYYPFGDHR